MPSPTRARPFREMGHRARTPPAQPATRRASRTGRGVLRSRLGMGGGSIGRRESGRRRGLAAPPVRATAASTSPVTVSARPRSSLRQQASNRQPSGHLAGPQGFPADDRGPSVPALVSRSASATTTPFASSHPSLLRNRHVRPPSCFTTGFERKLKLHLPHRWPELRRPSQREDEGAAVERLPMSLCRPGCCWGRSTR